MTMKWHQTQHHSNLVYWFVFGKFSLLLFPMTHRQRWINDIHLTISSLISYFIHILMFLHRNTHGFQIVILRSWRTHNCLFVLYCCYYIQLAITVVSRRYIFIIFRWPSRQTLAIAFRRRSYHRFRQKNINSIASGANKLVKLLLNKLAKNNYVLYHF